MASRRGETHAPSLRVPGSSKQPPKHSERPAKSRSLKEVPEKLAVSARGIAGQLLTIKSSMDKVMNTLKRKFMAVDDDHPKTVGDWNAVRKVSAHVKQWCCG